MNFPNSTATFTGLLMLLNGALDPFWVRILSFLHVLALSLTAFSLEDIEKTRTEDEPLRARADSSNTTLVPVN